MSTIGSGAIIPVGQRTPGSIGSALNKWGENNDIDTADAAAGQVIWPLKATVQGYLFIDSPIQLNLVSDSANDDNGGTGARTVKIIYQDPNGEEKTVIQPVTGLVNSPLPELSYGSFRMEVEESGALDKNDGNLSLKDGSANIYTYMVAGEGKTQISVQRVPNNRSGLVRAHIVAYSRAGAAFNNADMRLRRRKANGSIVTEWDPVVSNNLPKDEKNYFIGGITVNPGEWVYWECISVSANDTPIRGAFDMEFFPV
jgi:hypothetical protein